MSIVKPTMTCMCLTLEVANLGKTYDTGGEPVRALGGVSLAVKKGEFLAIMGASGSGKSTIAVWLAEALERQGVPKQIGETLSEALIERSMFHVDDHAADIFLGDQLSQFMSFFLGGIAAHGDITRTIGE